VEAVFTIVLLLAVDSQVEGVVQECSIPPLKVVGSRSLRKVVKNRVASFAAPNASLTITSVNTD